MDDSNEKEKYRRGYLDGYGRGYQNGWNACENNAKMAIDAYMEKCVDPKSLTTYETGWKRGFRENPKFEERKREYYNGTV